MKLEIYNKSIDTGELQLTGFGERFTHFGVVIYLLIFPTMILCFRLVDLINGNQTPLRDGEISLTVIPIALAIVAYFIQKKRLKFQVVKTHLKEEKLKELITEVAKELEWEKGSFNLKIYTITTNPKWFSGSWGEQITILFAEDCVYVNSICDLKKRSSIVSWGRNRRNENTLIDRIEREGQTIE